MRTACLYGLIAAFIGFIFMYLDSRLLDNPKSKTDYVKNMALIGGIVGFGIHMIGEDGFERAVGISSGGGDYGGGSSYLGDIHEEILTGGANF